MACICGSLKHQEEDDFSVLCPFDSMSSRNSTTTRRRRSIFGNRSRKYIKNAFADRGLDKFEALLADLDSKRQKILTQKGAEDISFVKFVYTSPNELKPIVVKFTDQRRHDRLDILENPNTILSENPPLEHQKDVGFVAGNNGTSEAQEEQQAKPCIDECMKKVRFDQWRTKLREWWKPSYYLPLFVILILVLLMFFGRSFTILCTSLGWYFVPLVNESLQDSKRAKKIVKKEKFRKLQDKHITSA